MSVTGVLPAIPASRLAQVNPGVLSASGNGLQLNGVILTSDVTDTIGGQILAFASQADVAAFFGSTSQLAGLASVYFLGPDNKTQSPAQLIIAQYALSPQFAKLKGGPLNISLAALQAIDSSLTVTINGTPITQTINLSAATSFSNAAQLMGQQLGITGTERNIITGSLSGTVMTVTAVVGSTDASGTSCNLNGTTLTVGGTLTGNFAVGQTVTGTGVPAGTTITDLGTGTGGAGTYTLSQTCTTESSETITASWSNGVIQAGDFLTGTGVTNGTWISSFGTGTGGAGTYNLSQSATTEGSETILEYRAGVAWNSNQNTFIIRSSTTGTGSTIGYGSGAAATSLNLTQALGAVIQPGSAGNLPDLGSPTAFMNTFIATAQNWASFMTDFEPTDTDKENFASWTNSQNNRYRYCMWDTNVLNTGSGGPSPAVGEITSSDASGTVMIYQNDAVTTLNGEKAAFSMSWAACLDFTRLNGRQTAAFKGQSGLLADVTNGTVANYLGGLDSTFGYGMNYYGDFTTPNQAFLEWQRGVISGPFQWDDTYTNQIWLNSQLQLAIMVGLKAVNSVPYANPGSALVESWLTDSIVAAVNFGAIVAGVTLSASQIAQVNEQAGVDISRTLFQRGWYLQVSPASAATRSTRSSPPCTLWYCDGGSIQRLVLASIVIQ